MNLLKKCKSSFLNKLPNPTIEGQLTSYKLGSLQSFFAPRLSFASTSLLHPTRKSTSRADGKVVQEVKRTGHPQWTMRHAFFADIGGSILHVTSCNPFLINKKWLATNDFIIFPEVTSLDIWDKSKADRLVKTIVCAQISWVTVSVLARAIRGPACTTAV